MSSAVRSTTSSKLSNDANAAGECFANEETTAAPTAGTGEDYGNYEAEERRGGEGKVEETTRTGTSFEANELENGTGKVEEAEGTGGGFKDDEMATRTRRVEEEGRTRECYEVNEMATRAGEIAATARDGET